MELMGHLRDWVTTGPLVLFFFVAGMELKAEVTSGSFSKKFSFLIPTFAAAGGMLFPAVIYWAIATQTSAPNGAWGVPMATDLPLAIIALSLFSKKISQRIRGFLLALAVADDLGSIIIVAFVYHAKINAIYLLIAAIGLALFWKFSQRSTLIAIVIALGSWYSFKQSGIHPTVIGIVLGILVSQKNSEAWSKRLLPFINYLILPVFIVTTLWIPWYLTLKSISSPTVLALIIARMIGKPLGITLFGLVALRVASSKIIQTRELVLIGIIGTLGLSVSMLFADLAHLGDQSNEVLLGVLLTVPVALIAIKISSKFIEQD